MSRNLSDIAILNIKCADYRCINSGISKNEANAKYRYDRKRWSIINYENSLSHIKMGKEISTFGNVETEKK